MILPYFTIPLLVGLIIQIIKTIIDFTQEKKFNISHLRRAGGFPSVHSGVSSSLVTLVLLISGYDSIEFAIVFIFSCLFWYDAMNVRYEAGEHAKYLNKISKELQNTLNFLHQFSLKERLGHTFLEVIGGIMIGAILTGMIYYYFL